jgi:mono/diheme cytochrome c family protein
MVTLVNAVKKVNLTSQETRDKSDGDLLTIIRDGTSNTVMPPLNRHLTPDELRSMVAYLRSLNQ